LPSCLAKLSLGNENEVATLDDEPIDNAGVSDLGRRPWERESIGWAAFHGHITNSSDQCGFSFYTEH
jgi:hypothetical protein